MEAQLGAKESIHLVVSSSSEDSDGDDGRTSRLGYVDDSLKLETLSDSPDEERKEDLDHLKVQQRLEEEKLALEEELHNYKQVSFRTLFQIFPSDKCFHFVRR